jgi:flagellar biosynthesis regulator FlaF
VKKDSQNYQINWMSKVIKGVDAHQVSTEMRRKIGELFTKRRMIELRKNKIEDSEKIIQANQSNIEKWNSEIDECRFREKQLLMELSSDKKSIQVNPIILYNQGRDKKYVHGKVWWFEKGFGVKKGDVGDRVKMKSGMKKYHRFHLGSMDWNLSEDEWKNECLRRFYIKMTK